MIAAVERAAIRNLIRLACQQQLVAAQP